jgi:hypothetical protein
MAANKTTVITAALHTLRSEGITSDTEDSPEARFADSRFDMMVDAFLTETDWCCAKKTMQLTRDADTVSPFEDLEYVFDLPADCLKPRSIIINGAAFNTSDQYYGKVNNALEQSYIIEGTKLFYSEDECVLSYTQQIDISKFRGYMVFAFTLYLASELAYGIANSMNAGNIIRDRYLKESRKAEASNNAEQSTYYRIGQALRGRNV